MAEIITHASTRLWQEVLCGASKPIDGPLVSTGTPEYVTCEDCKKLLPAIRQENAMPLNDTELKTLLEVAKHCAGPFQSALHEATWREEFRQRFTPATCAALVREVLRLREVEREYQALDSLTDRHLKFDLPKE